jgi:hypothetical protein
MKNIIVLFSFLVFSISFISCENEEGINSPDPIKAWGNPNAGSSLYIVDLLQDESEVGKVEIYKLDDGSLQLTYILNSDCAGRLTEVNVDLAKGNGSPFLIDFKLESDGSPDLTKFDSRTLTGVSVEGLGSKTVVVNFSYDALKDALGGEVPSKIYLTLHGVVSYEDNSGNGFIPPEDLAANVNLVNFNNPVSIYNFTFGFESGVTGNQTDFNGWCVDLSRSFTGANGSSFNFIFSYDTVPDCLIKIPSNLPKANWVINHREGYDWAAVQMALWTLLSPYQDGDYLNPAEYPVYSQSNYIDLINAATAYEELNGHFQPLCSDKVLVIAFDGNDPCSNLYQTVALELDAQCAEIHKSVIAYPYPKDNFSSPFPDAEWFRYISFNY